MDIGKLHFMQCGNYHGSVTFAMIKPLIIPHAISIVVYGQFYRIPSNPGMRNYVFLEPDLVTSKYLLFLLCDDAPAKFSTRYQ